MNLLHWQVAHAERLRQALSDPSPLAVADGSDTGTGKTYMTCWAARELNLSLVVICPKIMCAEWQEVARRWGVPIQTAHYDVIRTGKRPELGAMQPTPFRMMRTTSEEFRWTYANPERTLLVFDEGHKLGGIDTLNSELGIAAKRQGLRTLLLSATLIQSPMYCYSIGFMLGLHLLTNFWVWAEAYGVRQEIVKPARYNSKGKQVAKERKAYKWVPEDLSGHLNEDQYKNVLMERIRQEIGPRFLRLKKADVPDFPGITISPEYLETEDMPELESEFGMEARVAVERLMIDGVAERINVLHEQGQAVVVFVNFTESIKTLQKKFPSAVVIWGGQSDRARHESINSFQQNSTNLIVINGAAGGAGLSLHDLNGKPRAALVLPGWDAVQFRQILGRIHRAGSLSPATYHVLYASGVPVMRRMRRLLEAKLDNLDSLNDSDLLSHLPTPSAGTAVLAGRIARSSGPAPQGVPARDADQRQAPADPSNRSDGEADLRSRDGALIPLSTDFNSSETMPETPVNTPTPPADATGNHAVRTHARSSPSKLKSLEICPSYSGDNDGPVHEVTQRGTVMHEAMETNDDSKLLDEKEQALVRMCREYLADDLARAERVIIEPHLKTHDRDVQGFADLVIIFPADVDTLRRHAAIRDYKFGFNAVDDPSINPQAIAYSVAVFMENADVDTIHFAFLIPRLDLVLEHTFNRSDLPDMKLRLTLIAERVRTLSGIVYAPQSENCLYCGNKATCQALLDRTLVIANRYTAPQDRLALPQSFNPAEVLDPAQMALLLNLANVLEGWVDSVKTNGRRMRQELGLEIPGYKWIEKSGVRSVDNIVACAAKAAEYGVTNEEFLAACKVSLPKVSEAVRSHVATGKARVQQQFEDALLDAAIVSRGPDFGVLQREKVRPAVDVTATPVPPAQLPG